MGEFSNLDIQELIQELQTYQTELEMQNKELHRAQRELEESRNKYADLYDFAPVGYFILDENGVILEVNLTGATLLGMERSHLIKRPFILFMDGENFKTFHLYRKLLKTSTKETCEPIVLRKDGTKFYAQLESIPLFVAGEGSRFRIAMLDITERKQAEMTLQRAHDELEIRVQERTAELAKANEALQAEITERKQMEDVLRENFAKVSKKNRHETIISSLTRSIHQSLDFQEVIESAVETMNKNIDGADNVAVYLVEGEEAVVKAYRGYDGQYIKQAGRIPYPKGFTWRTIIENKPMYCADVDKDTVIGPAGRELGTKGYASMPIRFEGKTIGAICINSFQKNIFDEEELKLLEIVAQQIQIAINNAKRTEALHQSEERYRILFDQSPVGVYIFDKDFKITQCNERFAQILKSSYDKIVGVDLRKLRNQCISPLIEKVFEGQSAAYEGLYEATSSSAKLWVFIRLSPVRDADRNVIGGMAVVEDITARKRAEEALKESVVQLSKKNRYETIISAVTRSVHQSINLQDVLENAVEVMSKNIDRADSSSIYLVEGKEAVLKAQRGYTDSYIERAGRIPYAKGVTWKIITEGESRYVADIDKDTVTGPAGREMGIKSYLLKSDGLTPTRGEK